MWSSDATRLCSRLTWPRKGFGSRDFPTIIGPFGYTDLRGSLNWSLVDIKSLRTYWRRATTLNAAQLSAQDARDIVVLTVGNAYMLVLADQGRVTSVAGAGGHIQGFARPGGRKSRSGDRADDR